MGQVTLPPELAALPEDERDAVLDVALEIVRTPQPIEGLTRQQTKLIRILQRAAPRAVSYEALAAGIQHRDLSEPVSHSLTSVIITQIGYRRPDLREHIEAAGRGVRNPTARWLP